MTPYYQLLKERVDAGTLIFLSIVSPPRTGSTLLEKSLYNTYPAIAVQINEPSSQLDAGEKRVEAMYQCVWAEVARLEAFASAHGVDLKKQPLIILIKNLFYYIGQDKEWALYDDLVAHHLVAVRHPASTFESYTKAMIETLERQGIALEQVIEKDYALAHINWAHPMKTPLRQHIDEMNCQRNYASLGMGFRDTVVYQLPILEDRAYQQEIWAGARQKHCLAGRNPDRLAQGAGFVSWDDLVDQHLGTALHALKNLPPLLREPIDVLRYGWTATAINFVNIRQPAARLTVIDHYDFLLNSNYYLEKIGQIASLKLGNRPLGHERCAFNVGVWQGKPNEEPFLGEVQRLTKVLLPRKGPVPLDRLPAFLHSHIKEAFHVYLQILQSGYWLRPDFCTQARLDMTGNDGKQRIKEMDPVHAYVQITVAEDIPSWHKKGQMLQAIRSCHPAFFAYFDIIDGAVGCTGDNPAFGSSGR